MRRLPTALVAAATAVAVVSGCGGDKPARGAEDAVATAAPAARPPAVQQIVAQSKKDTPPDTVLAVIGLAKWGVWPDLVALYDPKVVRKMGNATIAGAYSLQRSSLQTTAVKVVDTSVEGGRAWVAAEVRRPGEASTFESYLLRRSGDRWRIAYDTFLERAIASYQQTVVQAGAAKTSPEATEAGQAAASQFRNLFLPAGKRPKRD